MPNFKNVFSIILLMIHYYNLELYFVSIKKSITLQNKKCRVAKIKDITYLYVHSNCNLLTEVCKRLIKLAREHSFVVVCDDVYNLLHYEDDFPPHRLFYYDDSEDLDYDGGNVISNGSFSKILSPALRVGWMECGTRISNIFKESYVFDY